MKSEKSIRLNCHNHNNMLERDNGAIDRQAVYTDDLATVISIYHTDLNHPDGTCEGNAVHVNMQEFHGADSERDLYFPMDSFPSSKICKRERLNGFQNFNIYPSLNDDSSHFHKRYHLEAYHTDGQFHEKYDGKLLYSLSESHCTTTTTATNNENNNNLHTSINLNHHTNSNNNKLHNSNNNNHSEINTKISNYRHKLAYTSVHTSCLFIFFISLLTFLSVVRVAAASKNEVYTNQWVIEVTGGESEARKVARQHRLVYVDKVMDNFYLVKNKRTFKRSLTSKSHLDRELMKDSHIKWVQRQVAKKRVKRMSFNDPKWPRMWYMNQASGYNMDIHKSWERGYTGRGVVVSILDDGIEKDHPDLKNNYDARASYDVNDHDRDPQPRYEPTNENKHGTRCAGEVAAEANNNICGIGVAFNAGIGGIRMLDGDVTDAVEARSLSWEPQHISIYSASWGPDDDGRTVDGPGPMAWRAFEEGVTKGRRGLGSIFVWASGNGGQNFDNCNCDGYTNLIYTLSISSVSEQGRIPWYSEACPSALATTYSSGSNGEKAIVTTDLNKDCTENHTGTSASAPLAAGICALVLEANPLLTWRDLQHIVVLAAKPANLLADDWRLNGAGRNVSHSFGFGIMDVDKMLDLAENWTMVPAQKKCIQNSLIPNKGLSVNSRFESKLNSDGCVDTTDEIRFLEHVQIVVSLATHRRGELEISLISPSGTRSNMLTRRLKDISTEGFNNWTFMSTHCWGEDPQGDWVLEVKNFASTYSPARLHRWTLILHGTSKIPYPIYQWNPPPLPNSYYPSKFNHHHQPFNYPLHQSRTNAHKYHIPYAEHYNFNNYQKSGSRKQHVNKPGLRSHHNFHAKTRHEILHSRQYPFRHYNALKPHPYQLSPSSSAPSFWSFSLPYTIVRFSLFNILLFLSKCIVIQTD